MYLHLQAYSRPTSLDDALRALSADGAAAVAGGTWINAGGHEAVTSIVDLQALGLGGIEVGGEHVRIGAGATLADLAAAPLPKSLAALKEAVLAEKNRAVRNRSTVGGRLCRDRCDARLGTALVALGARAVFAHAQGQSTLELAEFLARPTGKDLLISLEVPVAQGFSTYESFALTVLDIPFADVAVAWTRAGFRIATGCHGADRRGTVRLTAAEQVVAGLDRATPVAQWKPALIAAVRAQVPAHADHRASAEYRATLAANLVARLIQRWQAAA